MTQLTVDQAIEMGLQHHRDGRLQQAEAVYRQVLSAQPSNGQVLHLLGVVALQVGRADVARELIGQAIQTLQQHPSSQVDLAEVWNNFGLATRQIGLIEPAMQAFSRAVAANEGYVEAWNNLGGTQQEQGNFELAAQSFRKALKLLPDYPDALSNLGNALHESGQLEQAINAFQRSLQLQPQSPDTEYNLAKTYRTAGRLDEAIVTYQRALALRPDFVAAKFNLAIALLLKGDFERGWPAFESRWNTREFQKHRKDFKQPQWNGEPLAGRRILLHAEQGLGDSIQFVRYLPMVKETGAHIVVQCPADLLRLFRQSFGDLAEFVATNQTLPAFDVHCGLLSLPRIMETSAGSIPAATPYLNSDRSVLDHWRERMTQRSKRIGLVWAGRAKHWHDRHRSLDPKVLSPLASLAEITWYSMQKENRGNSPELNLIDWTEELKDFADTAGLIENLDLVISVDTAVAHLAGAMGKPVWVLLPFAPDWRWMLNRSDSPWYPSMRLFRQPRLGDWGSVINEVTQALKEWTP